MATQKGETMVVFFTDMRRHTFLMNLVMRHIRRTNCIILRDALIRFSKSDELCTLLAKKFWMFYFGRLIFWTLFPHLGQISDKTFGHFAETLLRQIYA